MDLVCVSDPNDALGAVRRAVRVPELELFESDDAMTPAGQFSGRSEPCRATSDDHDVDGSCAHDATVEPTDNTTTVGSGDRSDQAAVHQCVERVDRPTVRTP